MSTKTSIICILLLFACVGVAKWHHSIDVQEYEVVLEGDLYIMQALADRIEERDDYIKRLEAYIINQREAENDKGENLRPVDPAVPEAGPGRPSGHFTR